MSRPQEIIDYIATQLATVINGNTANIQGSSYTFQNTFAAANIYKGRKLLNVETDTYPTLSVVTPNGQAQQGRVPGNENIMMPIDIEAADILNNRDIYTVAMALLDDIRASIPVDTGKRSAVPLKPGYPGAPTWEIQEPPQGSDLLMVRRTYHAIYAEIYPI